MRTTLSAFAFTAATVIAVSSAAFALSLHSVEHAATHAAKLAVHKAATTALDEEKSELALVTPPEKFVNRKTALASVKQLAIHEALSKTHLDDIKTLTAMKDELEKSKAGTTAADKLHVKHLTAQIASQDALVKDGEAVLKSSTETSAALAKDEAAEKAEIAAAKTDKDKALVQSNHIKNRIGIQSAFVGVHQQHVALSDKHLAFLKADEAAEKSETKP